jgi:hypothetical protein
MKKISSFFAVCVFLIFMCIPAARADVRVSVTFAAGGVAGGIYFFFYYSTGHHLSAPFDPVDPHALFTHTENGWRLDVPHLNFTENDPAGITPYVDVIKIRF